MTSFAFILGSAPLWIASGAGAASRRILGTVVIVGMLAATVIAIFLIPVTFYLVEKFTMRFGRSTRQKLVHRRRSRRQETETNVTAKRFVVCLDRRSSLLTSVASQPEKTQRPAVNTPDTFRGADTTAPTDQTSIGDLKWFEVFKDEELQKLVRTAMEQNYDLRAAVARINAARANLVWLAPISFRSSTAAPT